jgi:hypothetical protein
MKEEEAGALPQKKKGSLLNTMPEGKQPHRRLGSSASRVVAHAIIQPASQLPNHQKVMSYYYQAVVDPHME